MLNLLTLTATEALRLLEDGSITSVELVEAYLHQIEKHNHQGLHLNAIISLAPKEKVFKAAKKLDEERRAGKIRSPLHGIPFVFKEVFTTKGLGLRTTAGAPCFASAKAKRTAPLIQHLIDSGLIILGTTNLTEFCGMKYRGMAAGWSAMGGQTQSPYIFGGLEKDEKQIGHSSIGGSSSGTSASVAAGFAPLGIGTECCGSLITPANRGALYALKCGHGEVDVEGVFHYTDCIDFIGGMAKSAGDLSLFTAALMQRVEPFDIQGGFEGLKIGFLDVKEWRLPDEVSDWPDGTREQMEDAYRDSMKRMTECGAEVVPKIDLPSAWETFEIDGKSPFHEIGFYQVSHGNMQAFIDEFADCDVRSIADILRYNEKHADTCLPSDHSSQDELHALLGNNTTQAECELMLSEMRRRGHAGLDAAFQQVDILIALADSPLCMYTTATGDPIGCVPLTTVQYADDNARPFGLCAAVEKGKEGLLLRFMTAFEAAFPTRPLPRPLQEGGLVSVE